MPEMINEKFENLNNLIGNLWRENNKNKALEIGLTIANEVIKIFGVPNSELDDYEQILNRAFSNAKFKNHKMESWFEKHPFFGSGRVALQHYDKGTYPIETKFYQFNDNFSKARVAASTKLEPNWEDSELTMIPEYKVGLDFFLDSKSKSLTLVVSKEDNLRILELSEKLNNTQINIFNKLRNCFRLNGIEGKTDQELKLEPQRTIHQTLWNALELKEVNKQFYEGISDLFEVLSSHLENQEILKKSVDDLAKQSKLFTNRLIGRILFIWFLKKKDVLSDKFSYFEINENSTEYYNKKLKKLFYEVLNKPIEERENSEDIESPYLNGGLFEPHLNDWNLQKVEFPINWFQDFYNHLNKFNFTTDESSPEYEQVAIDPEMLGRVFENLLASIVPETKQSASERKNKGTFYTPREIVHFMCKESLKQHIKNFIDNDKDFVGVEKLIEMGDSEFIESKSTGVFLLWGNRTDEIKLKVIDSLNNIKVLDPACGSGAFPIGFMQIMLKTLERLSTIYDEKIKRHRPAKNNEKFDVYLAKLAILKDTLHGCDIEPMAIEISKLRSWLSLIIDEKQKIEPLPNLEFNFVCANSLLPLPKEYQITIFDNNSYDQKLDSLIERYFESHSIREKLRIRDDFNVFYDELSKTDDLGERSKILKTWNPFKFDKAANFFDSKIMLGVQEFDVIIGNPPYIGESGNKPIFDIVKKSEFGKKYYLGKMDYFYFFFHLGINLLKDLGILSFISTNYYITADGARKLRKAFYNETEIIELINFNEVTIFDSARGQHDLITVLRKTKKPKNVTKQILFLDNTRLLSNQLTKILGGYNESLKLQYINRNELFSNVDEGEYKIRFKSHFIGIDDILNKIENNKKLEDLCDINQGLQANPLKIYVKKKGEFETLNILKKDIKPFYKNSDIYKWKTNSVNKKEVLYIENDKLVDKNTIAYLSKYKIFLEKRREFENSKRPWYELHRARDKKIFESPKILIPYRSKTNNFAYNETPWYVSSDVYILTNKDNYDNLSYILAILNSKLIFTWLYSRGKRKGEVLELFPTPLKQIPIPKMKNNIADEIKNHVSKILNNNLTNDEQNKIENRINELVYKLYDLNENEIKVINDFWNTKQKYK